MSRGMEGPTETLLIAGVVCIVFGFWGGMSCTHDSSPKAKADHQCEVAWVDANDGDPETKPAPIVDEPWCQSHNSTTMVSSETAP